MDQRAAERADDIIDLRIEDWRRRLIDLSHRNRLIAYKATRATTLHIAAPGLHDLLGDPERATPWDFYLPPEPEEGQEPAESAAATAVDDLLVSARDVRRPRRP